MEFYPLSHYQKTMRDQFWLQVGMVFGVCIVLVSAVLIVNYAVSIILVLVFMGTSIPVQLKYGNEKGRLAVVAIGVGGFAVIVGGIQLGKVFDIEMTAALQRVEKMGAGTVSVIGCIVSVILIVISYKISVRIMEKTFPS